MSFHLSKKILFLLCILITSPFVSILFGAVHINTTDIFSVISSHILHTGKSEHITKAIDAIVWQVRLPRVLLSICVGSILGVSGVILQAIVRNPLAEPYVLGVSSGASVGATISIIFVGTGVFSTSLFAFMGAILATIIVLVISGYSNNPLKLILAGLATSFGFQALTNLILFSSGTPESNQAVMFWMLGSLGHSGWEDIWWVALIATFLTIVASILGPILDAISSGDNVALSVGINPYFVRLILLIPVSLAVASAVSVAGGIGFVGLIIPHFMRKFVGASHRNLIIATSLASAIFLLYSDTIARIMFAPAEMPIGVITGIIGAPCLMLLLRRNT